MDVGVDRSAGLKLTDAKLLVDRASFAVDNGPAAKPFAQRGKRCWNIKGFLFSRADDVSGRH
jgi:hypothetical protein